MSYRITAKDSPHLKALLEAAERHDIAASDIKDTAFTVTLMSYWFYQNLMDLKATIEPPYPWPHHNW